MKEKKETLTVTRRRLIYEKIKKEGEALITDLSNQFDVTEVTIRNDLEYLEKKNLIMRARGGAMIVENHVGIDQHILEKAKIHNAEKKAIGIAASNIINNEDTIILDGGTTTAEIARNLDRFNQLTVITNALNIANILVDKPNIHLVVLGGILRAKSMSLVGPMAEKSLRNFYVDKAFVSADGFDFQKGAFTPNIEEASLNEVMISRAKEVILVTDSSKFKRKSLVRFCDVDQIHRVVTDRKISKEGIGILEDAGIEVITA